MYRRGDDFGNEIVAFFVLPARSLIAFPAISTSTVGNGKAATNKPASRYDRHHVPGSALRCGAAMVAVVEGGLGASTTSRSDRGSKPIQHEVRNGWPPMSGSILDMRIFELMLGEERHHGLHESCVVICQKFVSTCRVVYTFCNDDLTASDLATVLMRPLSPA